MFIDESVWIKNALADLPLPEGARVLNLGSSTREFRETFQPYIEENIFKPLRARGCRIVHLDAKSGDGVDVVCDLADDKIDVEKAAGGKFDLLICTNMLEHIEDRDRMARLMLSLVSPGGYLIVTVPNRFKYHRDPIDTRFRPTADEIVDLFRRANPGIKPIRAQVIPIAQWKSYAKRMSKYLFWGYRDYVRFFIPPLRWRQACALMRAPE